MEIIFDREKHVYQSETFEEIIKDTIRFFNGTPVHKLPPSTKFHGTGVYAIYYIGRSPYYKAIYEQNRLGFHQPIYVGKAVPGGWRQARTSHKEKVTFELFARLNEHRKSISQSVNLDEADFACRFVILEDEASQLISTVEAALVRLYKPIWNTLVDGFGNHDPGSGRYNQAKSDWDVIHPGRPWAAKCLGQSSSNDEIERKIADFFGIRTKNDAQ
jgi:hypothetical protein